MIKRPMNTVRVAGISGHDANRSIQWKLRISCAVSNTAGTTIENDIVESTLNCTALNRLRPKYSQFAVRKLISSNSHHTGADTKKSSRKSLRDRVQRELPVRLCTNARPPKCIRATTERTDKPSGRPAAASSAASKPRPGSIPPSRVLANSPVHDVSISQLLAFLARCDKGYLTRLM